MATERDIMLRVEDLNVRYGGIHAVQGLSFSIARGEIATLIGANGAGKSSTIRAIAGVVKAGAKTFTFSPDKDSPAVSLQKLPTEERVRRGIALSPEGRRILPHLTVEENLRLGAYIRSDDGIAEDLEHCYSLFPRLKERYKQKGGTLSGGEQQMLAVARALMSRPKLLMLDEPSLGLAPILVDEVFSIIQRLNAEGRTILLVEQNAFAALKIAHQAYVLEVGKLVMHGRGEDLLHDPRSFMIQI